jgi:hypothetical protein
MQALTRRLALRAAAKAALSVTVLGCGGITLTESSDAIVDSSDARGEAQSDAAACNLPPLGRGGDISQSTFDCCIDKVDGMLGDAASVPGADRYWTPAIPCCTAIITRLNDHMSADANAAANDFDGQVIVACCETLRDHGSLPRLEDGAFGEACTPWGPPVPPEMPGHFFDLEVA